MTETADIKKGLEGVVVDTTSISKVMPEINSLTYYGYPVQDLAEQCRFEEVAYLLWHGELPNESELRHFCQLEATQRQASPSVLGVIASAPKNAHPMDVLRTAVSYLGLEDPDTGNMDEAAQYRKAIRLFAQIPTLVAADIRRRQDKPFIVPKAELNFVDNFFYMCFGEVPNPIVAKAFDVSMTLYAEHGFNASTFTGRVISSSLADMHGAVTGAIASLKGPLHGGANEAVMHMLLEIKDPAKAEAWIRSALVNKRKVMGFGHRVYKKGDSRVPTMTKYYHELAKLTGETHWMEISKIVADVMINDKDIYPNLDYPAGPAYYLMGFDIEFFTPFFVMSRITGWTAHIMEQLASNRLIRPLSAYTGPKERRVTSIESRVA